MSEVSLNTLRQLRARAKELLRNVSTDLRPFVKADGTFRRTPDSPATAGDVNVTTTCSSLMALAVTNTFKDFYASKTKETECNYTASAIFRSVIQAPWMSSGLTANNAFTTTLVLRTFGFLEAEGLLVNESGSTDSIGTEPLKQWELHLGIRDGLALGKRLAQRADPASDFLWLSLPDKTRELLRLGLTDSARITASLALDLARIVESGWIYEAARFNKATETTRQKLAQQQAASIPSAYKLAEANHLLLVDEYPEDFIRPVAHSLTQIATLMASHSDNFTINKYPPSAAVLYWFVDGIARAKLALKSAQWNNLYSWAAKEFNHKQSLVVAEHDAMMDPVAMGMSACLCARLRAIGGIRELGTTKEHLAALPSVIELERSVAELISKQTRSGIWHKYFPMFHYQDAGSNFCFTFELLEALLHEFGGSDNTLLSAPPFIAGLERAITWCEKNHLKYDGSPEKYFGWNSGGDLDTLEKEQPESWSTAVVHMFLWELAEVTSRRIQHAILQKYRARRPKPPRSDGNSALGTLLDIEVVLKGKETGLSTVLKRQIIDKYAHKTEAELRRTPMKGPLSALLFGPPGTSKTEVTKAVADDLDWPLVEITPSEFVKGTLANVYLQADEIFTDLMDLAGVVVFFDEMDALVQTRDADVHLDITSQFLTTTMLPKLTSLHDEARVVFFMATNYQERFDAAIKRAGRFDLLLCMGPPTLSEKLDRLYQVYSCNDPNGDQAVRAGNLIKEYLSKAPQLRDRLTLYTFGEFQAFVNKIGNKKAIGNQIAKLGPSEFRKLLKDDSEYVTLKLSELRVLDKVVKGKTLADLHRKKFTLELLLSRKVQIRPIIRYLCDRQQSKEQY
jgi:ATPase family associated with various cellular activities (AAA)